MRASGGEPVGQPSRGSRRGNGVGQDHARKESRDEFRQREANLSQQVVEFVGDGDGNRDDQKGGEDPIRVEFRLPFLVKADADGKLLGVLAGQATARDQPVAERTAQKTAGYQTASCRRRAHRRRAGNAELRTDDRPPRENGAVPSRQRGSSVSRAERSNRTSSPATRIRTEINA
jgi:hypothetical protein